MARYRALYDENGKIYEEIDGNVVLDKRNQPKEAGFYVMPDISPYQSMIDGRMIMSRSQHRKHLKEHNCIEVGNEKQTVKPVKPPSGLKEEVIKAAYQHGLLRS